MKKKKIIHLPKVHNAMGPVHDAYIKAMLGTHPEGYPPDFVETLIEEKKKQLKKEKDVQKK